MFAPLPCEGSQTRPARHPHCPSPVSFPSACVWLPPVGSRSSVYSPGKAEITSGRYQRPSLVQGGPQSIHLLSGLGCASGLKTEDSEMQAKAGTLQSHG